MREEFERFLNEWLPWNLRPGQCFRASVGNRWRQSRGVKIRAYEDTDPTRPSRARLLVNAESITIELKESGVAAKCPVAAYLSALHEVAHARHGDVDEGLRRDHNGARLIEVEQQEAEAWTGVRSQAALVIGTTNVEKCLDDCVMLDPQPEKCTHPALGHFIEGLEADNSPKYGRLRNTLGEMLRRARDYYKSFFSKAAEPEPKPKAKRKPKAKKTRRRKTYGEDVDLSFTHKAEAVAIRETSCGAICGPSPARLHARNVRQRAGGRLLMRCYRVKATGETFVA